MALPGRKYWIHEVLPLDKGHLVAVCRYSPEAAENHSLKACSLKSIMTFYTPGKPRADTSLLRLPGHFVRVPSNVTDEKMEKIMSRAHLRYAARRLARPRTASFRRP